MNSKFFLKSLTVQGAIVLALSWILAQFGVEANETELNKVVEAMVAVGGFVMVIAGRMNAKHELHVIAPKEKKKKK